MAKRTADVADLPAEERGAFIMDPNGVCHRPNEGEQEPKAEAKTGDVEMPAAEEQAPPSATSTATSTPVMGPSAAPKRSLHFSPELHPVIVPHGSTSPEARAQLLNSDLGHLSVRELKARLAKLGAGEHEIAALAEKEELVELLLELMGNETAPEPPQPPQARSYEEEPLRAQPGCQGSRISKDEEMPKPPEPPQEPESPEALNPDMDLEDTEPLPPLIS
eukprot:TRINITY_DN6760_c1_g4_i3.p1 TRINITY_DN6760_c1_g4~~TRINITY_DN6760_c1_g4_i3.p1  ORF type:complete len:220 (+),score=68.97 TRINITY_DN6760_c1_g4_i3:90-749(+)